MEAKLIAATILRVAQFAEQVTMLNVKFRDIFREN